MKLAASTVIAAAIASGGCSPTRERLHRAAALLDAAEVAALEQAVVPHLQRGIPLDSGYPVPDGEVTWSDRFIPPASVMLAWSEGAAGMNASL